MKNQVEKAWKFAFEKLYCPKTKLVYDYLTDGEEGGNIRHLPTAEEVVSSYPNPCGWATGMEDSVLNGASLLEGAIRRFELTGEEEAKERARDLYEGLKTCATVSSQRGFLARSVLPSDGKTHYINSSRDQYTHFVYAMCLYYDCAISTEREKSEICDMLVAIAEKTEHDVTEENRYSLLREDGFPAAVCEMYGKATSAHESHRLPMIYLAAWKVSGDERWWKQYVFYRDWANELADTLTKEKVEQVYGWCYALLQMQYSLRVLYDYEPQEEYRAKYAEFMRRVAGFMSFYVEKSKEVFQVEQTLSYAPHWKTVPARCMWIFCYYGKGYYVPMLSEGGKGDKLQQLMRNLAEAIIVEAICPDFTAPKEDYELFKQIVESVDIDKATSYWALLVACTYYVVEATK